MELSDADKENIQVAKLFEVCFLSVGTFMVSNIMNLRDGKHVSLQQIVFTNDPVRRIVFPKGH